MTAAKAGYTRRKTSRPSACRKPADTYGRKTVERGCVRRSRVARRRDRRRVRAGVERPEVGHGVWPADERHRSRVVRLVEGRGWSVGPARGSVGRMAEPEADVQRLHGREAELQAHIGSLDALDPKRLIE